MSDLRRIGREVGRLPAGRGRRYPAELKQRIVRGVCRTRDDGSTWLAISEELGIPIETLRRWLDEDEGDAREMRPVFVAEPVRFEPHGVVVVTPDGYRIEGLDIDGATAVVRELSS